MKLVAVAVKVPCFVAVVIVEAVAVAAVVVAAVVAAVVVAVVVAVVAVVVAAAVVEVVPPFFEQRTAGLVSLLTLFVMVQYCKKSLKNF